MAEFVRVSESKSETIVLRDSVELRVEQESIVLSRRFDCISPFFYLIREGQLWWSSNYPELLQQVKLTGIKLTANKCYIRDYLAYQAPLTSQTLFTGIKFLRAGESHTISTNTGELVCCQFFPNKNAVPITSQRFERLLVEELMKLDPAKTAYHVSSGLDSSLLCLLAAKLEPSAPVHLATCRTRGSGCSNELDLVHRLAEDLDAELAVYDLTSIDVFSVGSEMVNKGLGYPLAHPSHLVEYALDEAILSNGFDTIVNGKGPDDCLAGYAAHLPSYASVEAHQHRLTATPDSLLTALFGDVQGDASSYWQNQRTTQLSLRDRLYYDARALTDSWNVVHSSLARHFGCNISSPFMQSEIRLGLFALDDSDRLVGNLQKKFMRESFAALYPDYLLQQPKAGFRLDLKPYFENYEAIALTSIILGNSGQSGDYVDANVVKVLVEKTLTGEHNYGWQLWSLFLVFNVLDHADL